jgi:2-keto-3-deoxy-L-rhamnonate aldolase RhmA
MLFRDRLLARERVLGSFLKIASTHPAEILGHLGFDFVVIDEEHAPLNRETTDLILLACRAHGMAGLVRVRGPGDILSVLDAGADGILVPHVTSAETAREVVALARYRGGKRGFSPTTRAGAFGGMSKGDHIRIQDARTTVIAMIEDAEAIDRIEDIIAVDGLDAVFVGRGDLAVSLGENGSPSAVAEATDRVLSAAREAGMIVMILATNRQDAEALAASSDQGFLRAAAKAALGEFSDLLTRSKDREE